MTPIHEQFRTICSNSAPTLLDEMKLSGSGEVQVRPGAKKTMNSELWHACAGQLVSLPQPGSLIYYFPQGHSEQVTASTRKTANSHIANYPNLPSQLMCQVHNVTLHADKDTDEIYAQMTLQPVKSESDVFPVPDFGHTRCKQPSDFFCKNLTASDTSTHGGFSVPRRSAEKLFPQLDYSMQPPNQELIVRDLHDNLWTFRHIYRGQPKRHLLTTGWSLFVGAKRLKAGDSVLFIRDDKSQLLVGVRRANRQQTSLPSSVLSADSMHMGVLAAAAHAAASLSPFTVYYNPRACSSEFIVPLVKYHKAAYTQVSVGMRFGMMFETEESIKRRYMGTIVGISDYDPLKWPKSKWRNLQVEWDEHGYGERPDRVNLWEIETPESLFIFPTQNSSLKRQCLPGFVVPGTGIGFGNAKPLYQTPENGNGILHPLISGLGSEQLMEVLLKSQTPIPDSQLGSNQSIYASILQNVRNNDISRSCSLTMPSFCAARSPVQQEEQVTKFMMQHKYQLHPAQQQAFPLRLQNQKPQNCVQQPGVGLDCASWEHMKPQEQFKSLPEQNFQENESNERNVDPTGSKCASSIIQSTAGEKSDTSLLVRNQVDENSQGKRKTPSQQHSESLNQLSGKHTGQNLMRSASHENLVAPLFVGQGTQVKEEDEPELGQRQLEPATALSPWLDTAHSLEKNIPNNLLACQGYHSQYLDHDSWMTHPSCYQPFSGNLKTPEFPSRSGKTDAFIFPAPENTSSSSADISSIVFPETFNLVETLQFSGISDSQSPQSLPNFIQGFFGAQELNPLNEVVAPGFLPFEVHDLPVQEEGTVLQDMSNSCGIRDSSDDSNNQSVTYSNLHVEASKGSKLASSCVSSTVLEAFSTATGSGFHGPEDLVGNFTSNQDMQSQVTSASLTDSQVFSLQEIPDSSGGASSGSIDVNEYAFLNRDPSKHVSQQRLRTYTKVQKLGSVGRSIDVTRFRNYNELTSAIACMFGLEGQLGDPRGSDWKLVYVDYENDVLLVGDDPWEEFVNCVRCIRILSPSEVQQMSQGGMMSQAGMQLMNCQLPPGQ